MKLPELSESASPEFTDADSCKRWLEHVPLANVGAAQRELATQLAEFNRFPAAVAQRLAVMEALREAVSFVQIEQARRFSNRALPMSEPEATAFTATIALWDEMRVGYERCLEADPFAESFYRSLMLCYQRQERRAEALEAFNRCRKALAGLKVEPSTETRAVYETVSQK